MKLNNSKKPCYTYFSLLSMISITMMIIAMLFAYRIIKIGPIMAPGGVFIFAITYTMADIITEVYGLPMVKQVIWSTFFCIIFFNLVSFFLIKLPVATSLEYKKAYDLVFGHNLYLLFGFSISFIISDFANAFAINKWKILFQGKYFWLRSIASSIIGESLFGIIAAALMYSNYLSSSALIHVVISTWFCKVITAIIIAYPANILVEILKKVEETDLNTNFMPLIMETE
ncbi:MAG: queuosine precursor transporter [Proteobacteria bacterium]|jgi:uncharacterized integral membrane protein (TIGR00697 family)|nr:queuosine precursor transporter [Pseudomonadota bacterium]